MIIKEILCDIMGITVGPDRCQGLVDVVSEKDFKIKIDEKTCLEIYLKQGFFQGGGETPLGSALPPWKFY